MQSLRDRKALSTLIVVAIIVIVVVAVIISIVAFSYWNFIGNQETRTYSNSQFTQVSISSALAVNIKQSNTYSITITASARTLDQIVVSQNGNTLAIGVKPGFNVGVFFAKAEITMPKLDAISVSGASHATATGFVSEDPFNAIVTGASSLQMNSFQATNITVDLSGASTLTANGQANDLMATVSGASTLNISGLSINDADMQISGASHATINLSGTLDANVSGASSLQYSGQPTLGNITTSGASSVTKK
jgi:Putative auto-transporter adhesin, head GIN domain